MDVRGLGAVHGVGGADEQVLDVLKGHHEHDAADDRVGPVADAPAAGVGPGVGVDRRRQPHAVAAVGRPRPGVAVPVKFQHQFACTMGAKWAFGFVNHFIKNTIDK